MDERQRIVIRLLAIVIVAASLVGCGLPDGSESPLPTAPDAPADVRLPTFEIITEVDGVPVGCDAIGLGPVGGRLERSPGEGPPWFVLRDATGRVVHVVWPEGFTGTLQPQPAIHDAEGTLVARLGDVVVVNIDPLDAAGTEADPYHLTGILIAGSGIDPATGQGGQIRYTGCFVER